MVAEIRVHNDHGVGVSIELLPDGRHKVAIVDVDGTFQGVNITLTIPKCRNWTKRLAKAIRQLDHYEIVIAGLASPTGAPYAKPNPSVAALRLVK